MTEDWTAARSQHLPVTAFPEPGHLVQLAYQDLATAATGGPQARLLGALEALPRPWSPSTCVDPRLLAALFEWLCQVVAWLNHDLSWQPAEMVPGCWPLHPALARELALLADSRWAAELAFTSDPMEEWHRSTLHAVRARVHADAAGCITGHRDWPGRARHVRERWRVGACGIHVVPEPVPADSLQRGEIN